MREVCLAIAKTVGWLPLTRFAWRIRFVVAAVAAAQSVADGRIAGGVVVAVFIALTYLAPRWQRQWDRGCQDDSDRFVAAHELGDALGRFLRRCPREPRTLERIHRLTGPMSPSGSGSGGQRRELPRSGMICESRREPHTPSDCVDTNAQRPPQSEGVRPTANPDPGKLADRQSRPQAVDLQSTRLRRHALQKAASPNRGRIILASPGPTGAAIAKRRTSAR